MLVEKIRWLVAGVALLPMISMATQTATDLEGNSGIELRVTDHQAGIEDFRSLGVRLKSIELHTKGAGRREGWINLPAEYNSIDIVPLKNGIYVSTGMYAVPEGIYDAVKVKFESVEGELLSNNIPKLSADDTTVAATMDLSSNDQVVVVLDLYVESLTDHEADLYVVKVKEIRVEP